MDIEKLINTITLGDCMDFLPSLPSGFADVLLTDPPYGIGADVGAGCFGTSPHHKYTARWDAARPDATVFKELLRVSKKQIIFGGNYFADMLPPSGSWVVWDKVGDIPFKNPYAAVELAWTNYTRPSKKITCIQQGFVALDKSQRIHPTQKPLYLISRLLEEYTSVGDLVLDPFSGSGTVACACLLTGRRFVSIERDPDYHAASMRRLENMRSQELLDLSSTPPENKELKQANLL